MYSIYFFLLLFNLSYFEAIYKKFSKFVPSIPQSERMLWLSLEVASRSLGCSSSAVIPGSELLPGNTNQRSAHAKSCHAPGGTAGNTMYTAVFERRWSQSQPDSRSEMLERPVTTCLSHKTSSREQLSHSSVAGNLAFTMIYIQLAASSSKRSRPPDEVPRSGAALGG